MKIQPVPQADLADFLRIAPETISPLEVSSTGSSISPQSPPEQTVQPAHQLTESSLGEVSELKREYPYGIATFFKAANLEEAESPYQDQSDRGNSLSIARFTTDAPLVEATATDAANAIKDDATNDSVTAEELVVDDKPTGQAQQSGRTQRTQESRDDAFLSADQEKQSALKEDGSQNTMVREPLGTLIDVVL